MSISLYIIFLEKKIYKEGASLRQNIGHGALDRCWTDAGQMIFSLKTDMLAQTIMLFFHHYGLHSYYDEKIT